MQMYVLNITRKFLGFLLVCTHLIILGSADSAWAAYGFGLWILCLITYCFLKWKKNQWCGKGTKKSVIKAKSTLKTCKKWAAFCLCISLLPCKIRISPSFKVLLALSIILCYAKKNSYFVNWIEKLIFHEQNVCQNTQVNIFSQKFVVAEKSNFHYDFFSQIFDIIDNFHCFEINGWSNLFLSHNGCIIRMQVNSNIKSYFLYLYM